MNRGNKKNIVLLENEENLSGKKLKGGENTIYTHFFYDGSHEAISPSHRMGNWCRIWRVTTTPPTASSRVFHPPVATDKYDDESDECLILPPFARNNATSIV